jgi:hypothetical protein
MSEYSRSTILFNATGIGLGVFLAGYVIKAALITESAPICSPRYSSAMEFALNSETGTAMTPIELQARTGFQSWGLLENASVVEGAGAPQSSVMQVALHEGTGSIYQEGVKPGGVRYQWNPSGMNGAAAACLTYSVWMPEEFDFGQGGVLPGLFGGEKYDPKARANGTNGFAARFVWRNGGLGELSVQIPDLAALNAEKGGGKIDVDFPVDPTALSVTIGSAGFFLPRGRWMSFEQELVLNSPGQADGLVRLWMDGVLRVEKTGLVWRTDETLTLTGVTGDVSYGGLDSDAVAPADTAIQISPISVRWN